MLPCFPTSTNPAEDACHVDQCHNTVPLSTIYRHGTIVLWCAFEQSLLGTVVLKNLFAGNRNERTVFQRFSPTLASSG